MESKSNSSRVVTGGLLALLCLTALPPRLYHFRVPPIDGQNFRQTLTASIIRNYVERDRNFLHPQLDDIYGENQWFYVEFPLYEYALALPMMALGYSEGLIRAFNIFCGLATLLVMFRFLRDEGLTTMEAVAGAACYGATPIAIYFDRALMMDSFVVTLGAIYLLFLGRWLRNGDRRWLAGAIVALSMAVVQKLPIVWPALWFGIALVWLRKGRRGIFSRAFLVSHGIAAGLLLGWVAYVKLAGYGLLSLSLASVREWYFGWHLLLQWDPIRFFLLRMANGFSIAWALLALLGAWSEWGRRRIDFILLAAFGISAFLVFPNLNIVHTHYQLPILFAVAPLTGLGLARIIEILAQFRPEAAYALLAGCMIGATGYGFQVALWSHFPLELRLLEAAQELQLIPQNGPRMYYIEGGYLPTIHYLSRRRGLIVQNGQHPHSHIFNRYQELVVYGREAYAPAPIAHSMEPFRLTARYHCWKVYRRIP